MEIDPNLEDIPQFELDAPRAREELESLNLQSENQKHLNSVVGNAILWVGRAVVFSAIVILLVRAGHLIFPTSWLWVSQERLNEIDHILIGVATGLVARFWPASTGISQGE